MSKGGRPKAPLILSDDERQKLETWASRPKSTQRLATRARIILDRDPNGELRSVSAGWRRRINFRYDSAPRIVRADTGWGLSMTTVDYAYDAGGRLASVKSRQLSVWTVLFELIYAYETMQLPSLDRMSVRYDAEYTYDAKHRLRRVREPGLELDHEYDVAGRVIRQDVTGWGSWTFTYTQGADGRVAHE